MVTNSSGNEVGRLFWKFLLAFWAILLTASGGVGLVVWWHKPTVDSAADHHAETLIHSAAAALQRGGEAGLRAYLADLRGGYGDPVFAVDPTGTDILGRPVPPDRLQEARSAVTEPDRRWAMRAVDPNSGHVWLLFIPAYGAGPGIGRHMVFPPPGPPPDFGPGHGPAPPPPRPPGPWLPIAAGLLASLAFSALLAWYVAKPIRTLRKAFSSVAEGKLDTHVAETMGGRRDELADLGRDFDTMAQRIGNLIGAQRRLFHDVSHELRSPLARLHAAIGLVRQNPEQLPGMLDRLEREADRLDDLVGELLALARLESGVTGEGATAFDALALLEAVIDDARFEAEATGGKVLYQSTGIAMVKGQPDWLARAFENVIRNAIRYTEAGTAVEIDTCISGQSLRITVLDRGSGVAEDELKAIFEPFQRGRRQTGKNGFGLGLAIAQRAVQAHGGHIQARNREEAGLRVEIELPLLEP